MNTVKRRVTVALTSVAAVFGIFAPIMGDLRPPQYWQIAVGTSYLVSVVIYLFLIYLLEARPQNYASKLWKIFLAISLASGIIFGAIYITVHVKWTNNGQIIRAYSPKALLWIVGKKELGGLESSRAEVEEHIPEPYIEGSEENRALVMVFIYIATVAGFCATIFALCELTEVHSVSSCPTDEEKVEIKRRKRLFVETINSGQNDSVNPK